MLKLFKLNTVNTEEVFIDLPRNAYKRHLKKHDTCLT